MPVKRSPAFALHLLRPLWYILHTFKVMQKGLKTFLLSTF